MALQFSGKITDGDMRNEMRLTSVSPFSFASASLGLYVPINMYNGVYNFNTGQDRYPGATTFPGLRSWADVAPDMWSSINIPSRGLSMSGWYGYCHLCAAPCDWAIKGVGDYRTYSFPDYPSFIPIKTATGVYDDGTQVVISWTGILGSGGYVYVYSQYPWDSSGMLVASPLLTYTVGSSGNFTHYYYGATGATMYAVGKNADFKMICGQQVSNVTVTNNSTDLSITAVTVNGVSVVYSSGDNFTVGPGQSGTFTTDQIGTFNVQVTYSSHSSGQNLSISGNCHDNLGDLNTSGGAVTNSVNTSGGVTIIAANGDCA